MKQNVRKGISVLFTYLLCVCLLFSMSSFQACAAEYVEPVLVGSVEINDASRITVSEALTAEGMVQRYAESAGISYDVNQ